MKCFQTTIGKGLSDRPIVVRYTKQGMPVWLYMDPAPDFNMVDQKPTSLNPPSFMSRKYRYMVNAFKKFREVM